MTLRMTLQRRLLNVSCPIRNEYDKLIADKQYLMDICQRGADSAKRISQRTLKKVYKKVGFVL